MKQINSDLILRVHELDSKWCQLHHQMMLSIIGRDVPFNSPNCELSEGKEIGIGFSGSRPETSAVIDLTIWCQSARKEDPALDEEVKS